MWAARPLCILALFAAGSGVSAHGFLSAITINGQTYNGNNPSGNNDPSVIRKIDSPNPNYGASNPALTCGPDELAASQVADVNPGDSITFSWKGEDYSSVSHISVFRDAGSTSDNLLVATQYGSYVGLHGPMWLDNMRSVRRYTSEMVQDSPGRQTRWKCTMVSTGPLYVLLASVYFFITKKSLA